MARHVAPIAALAVILLAGTYGAIGAVHVEGDTVHERYMDPVSRRMLVTKFTCADIVEITIDQIQQLYFERKLSAVTLVTCYLRRIADISNPLTYKPALVPYAVNAVLEINPRALVVAGAKDLERRTKCAAATSAACLGPMHGIPVLLKDNVAADSMNNTAGSYVLLGCKVNEATLTKKLRAAGAIILGKTGLSEWANYRGSSVSGWSGRGGQVFNPYVRYSRNNLTILASPYTDIPSAVTPGVYTFVLSPGIVSGSSSGSAVAAATSLATVTIGSETSGSILSPSSSQGLVGIKPTVGLISRAGVVPLSHSQDTAGPMCRTVRDAVYVLEAAYGVDPSDQDTVSQIGLTPTSYIPHLKADGLSGKRIAAAPLNPNTVDPLVQAAYADAIIKIRAAGAIVDVFPAPTPFNSTYPLVNQTISSNLILPTDFKVDMALYLAGCTWASGFTPIKTLADMLAFNKANYLLEFQGGVGIRGDPAYGNFYQQTWETSQTTKGLYDSAYLTQKALAAWSAESLTNFFNGMNDNSAVYDALMHAGSFTGTFARARYPSITVPFTKTSLGLPNGLYFSGPAYSEATLIELAYGFEQTIMNGVRFLPTYCNNYTCAT